MEGETRGKNNLNSEPGCEELDREMGAAREEVERHVLTSWLWGAEMESLVKQWEDGQLGTECTDADYLEDKYRYVLQCYGHGPFPYKGTNPTWSAQREEKWEQQIVEEDIDPIPKRLRFKLRACLPIHEQFHSDLNLASSTILPFPLPSWQCRWLDGNDLCHRAIQVFGLKIHTSHNKPIEIYGVFAFRDGRNTKSRNYIFQYSREEPFKLNKGSSKLQPLLTPPRGIYAVGKILIEYHLVIKGQEEEDDKILIDGVTQYTPRYFLDKMRLHLSINSGHSGSVELQMVHYNNAVLGTLDITLNRTEGSRFDSLVISADSHMIVSGFLLFTGKLCDGKLPPLTVIATHGGVIRLHLLAYSSHSGCQQDIYNDDTSDGHFVYDIDDVNYGYVDFIAQRNGSCVKLAQFDFVDIDVSAKVTWSGLLNDVNYE